MEKRSAWYGLREAGNRAGLRKVLRPRPWGNPNDPSEAKESAVLEVGTVPVYILYLYIYVCVVYLSRVGHAQHSKHDDAARLLVHLFIFM